jgi:hypothetical protein
MKEEELDAEQELGLQMPSQALGWVGGVDRKELMLRPMRTANTGREQEKHRHSKW